MTFQLDMTGIVDAEEGQYIAVGGQLYMGVGSGILDAFTQGYIEAMLTEWRCERGGANDAFRYLAPETLAQIIADCEAWRATDRGVYSEDNGLAGRSFWAMRQSQSGAPGFAPLTVQLGDDGKVRFAS